MIIRIVDFETTGLPPDDCQIVEVATLDLIIAADGIVSRGRAWSSLVNPGRQIPPQASAIHHITDEMVQGAPSIEDIKPTILGHGQPDHLDDPPDHFAAHNARFEAACAPWLPQPMICTYKLALAAWPEAPGHGIQVLRYWLKIKLAEEAGPPHRAAGDCYVTGAILRRLRHAGNSVENMVTHSTIPALLPKLRFGKYAGIPTADVPTDYWHWIINKSGFDDEDVLHTARSEIAARRAANRQRSPV